MNTNICFKPVNEFDLDILLEMIKELAVYENMLDQVTATVDFLHQWIIEKKAAEAYLIIVDEKVVGYMIYFYSFSTFLGRGGIYLEDLFIRPSFRNQGIGKAALLYLMKIAVQKGVGRIDWSCLNWNQSAIDFYQSLDAQKMEDWRMFRLSREKFEIILKESESCER